MKEENSLDSIDGNNTRLSDLHNTTLKTEEDDDEERDSEEDKPLVNDATSLLFFIATSKSKVVENTYF